MKIRLSELRGIIKEELKKKKSLNEDISKGALQVYGYAGIKPKYKREGFANAEEKFGAKAVDEAEKLAPKYIAFAKKVKDFLNDPMVDDFAKIAKDSGEYGGVSSIESTAAAVEYILRMKK